MRNLPLFALMLLIAGCATKPTPISQARPAPPERIYYHDPSTDARIIVVRDTGLQAGAVYAHLFINGKRAASLNPGEMVTLNIPAGDFTFGIHLTDPLHAEAMYSIDQSIKLGSTYYYRVLVDHNGARLQRFFPE